MLHQLAPAGRFRLTLVQVGAVLLGLTGDDPSQGWRPAAAAPSQTGEPSDGVAAPARATMSLERMRLDQQRYVAELDDGAVAELTLDPRLQRLASDLLQQQNAPLGAVVMLSVEDGRILALAGRDASDGLRANPQLALKPWAPAASIFKIVTAAALLSQGVTPDERVCYHGGVHALDASNLEHHARLDRSCASFAFGLAKSQNAIVARLVHDHLRPETLERMARTLGFGGSLPFDVPLEPSRVSIPVEPLAFAKTAAGFWQSLLSPLHGAYLAAVIARDGSAPALRIVDRLVAGNGALPKTLPAPRRVLDPEVARAVGEMMVGTTSYGTARGGFHDRRGRAYLPGIPVAGKTGTLNGWEGGDLVPTSRPDGADDRFLAYSWFVGFAPADNPQVAFAVTLGNAQPWNARAHTLARQLLAGYFAGGRGDGGNAVAKRSRVAAGGVPLIAKR